MSTTTGPRLTRRHGVDRTRQTGRWLLAPTRFRRSVSLRFVALRRQPARCPRLTRACLRALEPSPGLTPEKPPFSGVRNQGSVGYSGCRADLFRFVFRRYATLLRYVTVLEGVVSAWYAAGVAARSGERGDPPGVRVPGPGPGPASRSRMYRTLAAALTPREKARRVAGHGGRAGAPDLLRPGGEGGVRDLDGDRAGELGDQVAAAHVANVVLAVAVLSGPGIARMPVLVP